MAHVAQAPITKPAPAATPARVKDVDYDEDMDRFFDTSQPQGDGHRAKRARLATELDRFMDDDDLSTTGFEKRPLKWWQYIGSTRYPTLAKMAIDLFSIPGMSSECERVFSHAKKMIRDERHNLKPPIIEACQCQGNWLRNEIIPTIHSTMPSRPPQRAPLSSAATSQSSIAWSRASSTTTESPIVID